MVRCTHHKAPLKKCFCSRTDAHAILVKLLLNNHIGRFRREGCIQRSAACYWIWTGSDGSDAWEKAKVGKGYMNSKSFFSLGMMAWRIWGPPTWGAQVEFLSLSLYLSWASMYRTPCVVLGLAAKHYQKNVNVANKMNTMSNPKFSLWGYAYQEYWVICIEPYR
jgi:hypothetical protein